MLGNRFADDVLDEDSLFENQIMSSNMDELYIPDTILEFIQEQEYINYLHSFQEEALQEYSN